MGKLHDVAERLLNVMRERNGWPPTTLDSMLPEHRSEWLEDARAAVEALREPDDDVLYASAEYQGDSLQVTTDAWTAMIDTILDGDTNGHR